MSERASSSIGPPAKTPEELAEIRAMLDQVRGGDFSGTAPWDEIAAELDLPSHRGA
jgi:hypothetical protein